MREGSNDMRLHNSPRRSSGSAIDLRGALALGLVAALSALLLAAPASAQRPDDSYKGPTQGGGLDEQLRQVSPLPSYPAARARDAAPGGGLRGRVTEGTIAPIPIAIPVFLGPDPKLSTYVADVISADLDHSGLFQPLDRASFLEQVRDVTASVDSVTKGPASGPGNSLTLVFDDEISRPTSMLTADMKSHLECTSDPFALTASVTDKTITLKAGDVTTAAGEGSARINVSDSFIIGLAFGSAGAGQEDVNADGTVNVLDLIHVGRNYGAVTGACS